MGYNEAAGEADGTTLIVSEVPPEEPDRCDTFSASHALLLMHEQLSQCEGPWFGLSHDAKSPSPDQLGLVYCLCLLLCVAMCCQVGINQ